MASKVVILGAFADTLVLNVYPTDRNFQKEKRALPTELRSELDHLKKRVQDEEEEIPTRFVFRGGQLLMRAKGGEGFNWIMHNADLSLAVNRGSKMQLWAQVRCSSEYLWKVRDLGKVVTEVHLFLSAIFGQYLFLEPSAIDLAVDVAFFEVGSIQEVKRHFVSRAQLNEQHPLSADGLVDGPDGIKLRWGRLTGLPFGSRNGAVSALIYDKTHEIKYKRPEKAWFYDLWRVSAQAQGIEWTEKVPVWRVEVRFKRPALGTMRQKGVFWGLDDAYDLERHVSGLWAYAVGHVDGGDDRLPDGWLRYVVPSEEDSNRSRWLVHPDWEIVQSAFEPVVVEASEFEQEQQEKEELLQEVDAHLEEHPMPTSKTPKRRHVEATPRQAVPDPLEIDLTPYVRARKRQKNMRQMVAQIVGCAATFEAWRCPGRDASMADLSEALHALYEMGERYLLERKREFPNMVGKKKVIYSVVQAVA